MVGHLHLRAHTTPFDVLDCLPLSSCAVSVSVSVMRGLDVCVCVCVCVCVR